MYKIQVLWSQYYWEEFVQRAKHLLEKLNIGGSAAYDMADGKWQVSEEKDINMINIE